MLMESSLKINKYKSKILGTPLQKKKINKSKTTDPKTLNLSQNNLERIIIITALCSTYIFYEETLCTCFRGQKHIAFCLLLDLTKCNALRHLLKSEKRKTLLRLTSDCNTYKPFLKTSCHVFQSCLSGPTELY